MLYEIHITVKTEEIDKFKHFCSNFNIKPIVLDLQVDSEVVMQDVMTSSTIDTTKVKAIEHMEGLCTALFATGFDVTRKKLEAHPYCKEAIEHHWRKDSSTQYFETHIALHIRQSDMNRLERFAKSGELHMSRNRFKTFDDDSFVQMLTKRWYKWRVEEVELDLMLIKESLDSLKFKLYKDPILEFALYDSNVNHDSSWTGVNK